MRARLSSLPALRFLGLGLVAVSSACRVEPSPASSPASSPPVWVDAPPTLDVYEGRSSSVPVSVRTNDATNVSVTVASEGVEAEIAQETAIRSDGLWHGTLRVRAGYALDGVSLRVHLEDHGGERTVVSVALRTHKLAWRKRLAWVSPAGPQTREHGVFVTDPEARAAFLLQGSGYSPQWKPIADSWRLDLLTGAWEPWIPTGDVPPAGAARRVAQIPGTKKAYVYGGYTGFEATEKTEGDLYRVDLASPDKTFVRLTTVGAITPRQLHTLAWDPTGEQLVVFGGFTDVPQQDALDDVWLGKVSGDSATWTKVEGNAPSARYGAFSALDVESRRLVVWSGGQFPVDASDPVNAAQDAWALDLGAEPPTWSKLVPGGAAPRGRRNGCAMHDPIGRRLFVFGGTSDAKTTEQGLFVLSLEPGHEAWSKLDLPDAPPLRSSGFGFATPDGDLACAFGNGVKPYADVNFLGYAD